MLSGLTQVMAQVFAQVLTQGRQIERQIPETWTHKARTAIELASGRVSGSTGSAGIKAPKNQLVDPAVAWAAQRKMQSKNQASRPIAQPKSMKSACPFLVDGARPSAPVYFKAGARLACGVVVKQR